MIGSFEDLKIVMAFYSHFNQIQPARLNLSDFRKLFKNNIQKLLKDRLNVGSCDGNSQEPEIYELKRKLVKAELEVKGLKNQDSASSNRIDKISKNVKSRALKCNLH